MARKAKAYVLDTWAVIAYLEDEPSAPQIADLIASAHEDSIPVFMTVVNVGEVWYIIAREVSQEEANKSIKELHDLRIQFENVDWELTQEAARFKSQHKMSYADCFAAALAKIRKAELITGDKEFKVLQDEIKISWI
ncbi:MAG TPA: type II toxin-antitoxin system VapC family toxin [Anaerolineales bacterium]|nr:type II toxin-antitoxin system VapC family toxin [Anaerolineales bacterium]